MLNAPTGLHETISRTLSLFCVVYSFSIQAPPSMPLSFAARLGTVP